jgi:hypothetical protein
LQFFSTAISAPKRAGNFSRRPAAAPGLRGGAEMAADRYLINCEAANCNQGSPFGTSAWIRKRKILAAILEKSVLKGHFRFGEIRPIRAKFKMSVANSP